MSREAADATGKTVVTCLRNGEGKGTWDCLDATQAAALDKLKALCSSEERKDSVDSELLRFLRARKYDVQAAYDQFTKYRIWYKENNMSTFTDQLPLPDKRVALLRKCCPTCIFHGYSKCGMPIYFEKTGQINTPLLLANFSDKEILLGHLYQQEILCKKARENSLKLNKSIDGFCLIMDLKKLNMGHRAGVRFTEMIAAWDRDYYPERMGRCFVVNAPWVFSLLWPIINAFLDPVTASKIQVLGKDYKNVLLAEIDADNLPEEYGGKCKTCETAPDCIKVYDTGAITDGLDGVDEKDLVEVEVVAGQKFSQSLPCKPGMIYSWFFRTKAHDIGFQASFRPQTGKEEVITNYCRLNTKEVAGQGTFVCEKLGTLELVWDNSYSWMSSKYLLYATASVEPEQMKGAAVGAGDKDEEKKA